MGADYGAPRVAMKGRLVLSAIKGGAMNAYRRR